MPWSRTAAFTGVTVGIGVGGHALTSDHALNVVPVLLLACLAATLSRAAAAERHGAGALTVAVVLGQALTHVVLAATGTAGALGQAAGAHAGHPGHARVAEQATSMPLVPMLLVHVAATALGVVALLRLERRAFRSVLEAVRTVVAQVRLWLEPRRARCCLVPVQAVTDRGHAGAGDPTMRWSATSGVRRGPPVAA